MLFELLFGAADYLATNALVKAPGKILQNKFIKLCEDSDGTIAGKTYAEIVAACGNPSSVDYVGDGTVLKQWMATSYHLALLFDENDVCLGISSETSV